MATELIVHRKAFSQSDVMLLAPSSPVDLEHVEDIPFDVDFKIVATVPRNLAFHKKFFALLKVIFDYMPEEERARLNILTVKELLNRLKIDLGLYTLHIVGPGSTLPEGTPVFIPDSISFGKMDDSKFSRFYKGVIAVAIGKYVTAQTEESMMQIVNQVMRFE